MKLPILALILASLVLCACVQNPGPTSAGASPSPTATPNVTATPIPSPTLSPSPTPTAFPVPTASVNASADVPALEQAALRLAPILNDVFNVSRTTKHKDTVFKLIDTDVWVMGDDQSPYVYTLTLANARTHWLPEDLLQTAQSASGTTNGYLSYTVGGYDTANVMKCYGQRYELNLNLKGYSRTWFNLDYQPLIRRIMGQLVDACPP